uniref:Uncharacterized protein n=1 Tax=Arundo donax TaxID=35708 RepID=A0A0A9CEL0_ARUDO
MLLLTIPFAICSTLLVTFSSTTGSHLLFARFLGADCDEKGLELFALLVSFMATTLSGKGNSGSVSQFLVRTVPSAIAFLMISSIILRQAALWASSLQRLRFLIA